MSWTLESEICSAAGRLVVADALVALGVCDEACGDCSLEIESDWHRAGAETYGLVAKTQHSHGGESRLYLKACVALGDLSGVGRIVEDWVFRRSLIGQHGVSVPRLYAVHGGTIVEEYVPYKAIERLRNPISRDALIERLGVTAGVLTRLGFPTLSVDDWMSRGEDVVVVDFGQDLGPPAMSVTSHAAILDDVVRLLERSRVRLRPLELQRVSQGFERAVGNGKGTATQ